MDTRHMMSATVGTHRIFFSEAMIYHYFDRSGPNTGVTVSKKAVLLDGDFQIDEYIWPAFTLWFVADDRFTEQEREHAAREFALMAIWIA